MANHRKHHQFSDREGDPHSPHAGYGGLERFGLAWRVVRISPERQQAKLAEA